MDRLYRYDPGTGVVVARDPFQNLPPVVDGQHVIRGPDGRVRSIGSRAVDYGPGDRPTTVGGQPVAYDAVGNAIAVGDTSVVNDPSGTPLSLGGSVGDHPDPVAQSHAKAEVARLQRELDEGRRRSYRADLRRAPIWIATACGGAVGMAVGAGHYAALARSEDHVLLPVFAIVIAAAAVFAWCVMAVALATGSEESLYLGLVVTLFCGFFVGLSTGDFDSASWGVGQLAVPHAVVAAALGHGMRAQWARKNWQHTRQERP